jgi:transposase
MYYIGLDVHKKTISYCVKDAAGKIDQEGKIGSTRRELDAWVKTLPQPIAVQNSECGLPREKFEEADPELL